MNLETFLSKLQHYSHINIIGPMIHQAQLSLLLPIPTIFVDGGANIIEHFSSPLALKVGDGDSTEQEMDVLLKKEKDFTDLHYGLSIIPQYIKQISLWGFLGGRQDHHLANFGEVFHFLNKRKSKTIATFDQNITACSPGSFGFCHHGPFSLLCLEKAEVKLIGNCKYQLEKETSILPLSGHTLSNTAHGEINIESDKPIFLFLGE